MTKIATGTQPSWPWPWSAAAMLGAKPPMAKPICDRARDLSDADARAGQASVRPRRRPRPDRVAPVRGPKIATGTQPSWPWPWSAAAMLGAKPPMAKPIWVLIAVDRDRARDLSDADARAGQASVRPRRRPRPDRVALGVR
jgi:hypothetical protein